MGQKTNRLFCLFFVCQTTSPHHTSLARFYLLSLLILRGLEARSSESPPASGPTTHQATPEYTPLAISRAAFSPQPGHSQSKRVLGDQVRDRVGTAARLRVGQDGPRGSRGACDVLHAMVRHFLNRLNKVGCVSCSLDLLPPGPSWPTRSLVAMPTWSLTRSPLRCP